MSAAKQICNGLKQYYKSLNYPYNNIFYNFCVEEDFIDCDDEQLLRDELECQDAKESRLVEFYKNDYKENIFPFNYKYQTKDEDLKQQRILSIITQCHINPNIQFSNGDITTKHVMDEREETSPLSSQTYYEFIEKNPIIKKICDMFNLYFKKRHKKYDSFYSIACCDEYIDDNIFIRKVTESPSDDYDPQIIVNDELLDNFPFSLYEQKMQDVHKRRIIFDLMVKWYKNQHLFINLPDFLVSDSGLKEAFYINEQDFKHAINIYKQQCPNLYNNGIKKDRTCLYLLAIGLKYQYPYWNYLNDDFQRRCIEHSMNVNDTTYTKHMWSEENRHIIAARKLNIKINKEVLDTVLTNDTNREEDKYHKEFNCHQQLPLVSDIIDISIPLYNRRICSQLYPHLQSNQLRIDDSLEITARYFETAVQFINSSMKKIRWTTKSAICPFQMDLVFAFNNPIEIENKNDDGDEDEDEDDDDCDYMHEELSSDDIGDDIGNIEDKLKSNHLNYVKKNINVDGDYGDYMVPRDLMDLMKHFKEKYQNQPGYPHNKRFITMIDRRTMKTNEATSENPKSDSIHDKLYLYEPPSNCRDIPKNAVPEWGINASKTCILPKNIDNGNGNKEENGCNIGADSECKGSLLTFSFHVIEKDVIRCYLYWNGRCIYFVPNDIKNVLTKIFNMKWKNPNNKRYLWNEFENKMFIEEERAEFGADGLIERINPLIKDDSFLEFRAFCGQRDDPIKQHPHCRFDTEEENFINEVDTESEESDSPIPEFGDGDENINSTECESIDSLPQQSKLNSSASISSCTDEEDDPNNSQQIINENHDGQTQKQHLVIQQQRQHNPSQAMEEAIQLRQENEQEFVALSPISPSSQQLFINNHLMGVHESQSQSPPTSPVTSATPPSNIDTTKIIHHIGLRIKKDLRATTTRGVNEESVYVPGGIGVDDVISVPGGSNNGKSTKGKKSERNGKRNNNANRKGNDKHAGYGENGPPNPAGGGRGGYDGNGSGGVGSDGGDGSDGDGDDEDGDDGDGNDDPNEDGKYDEEKAVDRLSQILLDLLNNPDLDDDELRVQLAEIKPKTVQKVSSEIQTLHKCMQRIVDLSTVTPKQFPHAPSFSTPSLSTSATSLSDPSSFKRKTKTNIIEDHPKCIQPPNQELIENTKRKQDEYYCEPPTSIRVQNNIFISRELTSEIIPSRTQINFQNVKCYSKHKRKKICNCKGTYLWLDMDVAMQFKHNKYRSKNQKVFNTGFTDANTKDELFCIIEAVTNNEDDSKSEARQHPWEMKKKLCTAKMIMNECKFEKNQLPKPIRLTKQFQSQLQQAAAIKEYLNDSRNIFIENTKWCRVKVFSRLNNKRRKVLSIEQYEFMEELKKNQAFKIEDMELIPILMFKGERYQIHHIIRVPVDGSYIAISLFYEEKQKKVKVTGIHMNKSMICQQHQWIDLDHLDKCHCFDNFNIDLDDLKIGDIDSEIKRLRQKNKDLELEIKDKDKLIKQMQIHQESDCSSSALIDFRNGYESTSSSNVSICSK